MKNKIGYIDTSDKIDHGQLIKNMIFNTLDRIEDLTSLMAHEIPELNEKLQAWQDGKTRDIYFLNYLNKYFDSVNGFRGF